MTAPKAQRIDLNITVSMPGIENLMGRLLEHTYELMSSTMSVIRGTHRLAELGYASWQELHHYKLQSAKADYTIRLEESRKVSEEEYMRLKEAGKLIDVWLLACGPQKISVIKAIREMTYLGLKEAKDIADWAPHPIRANLTPTDAEILMRKIREAGATVEARMSAP
jgi:ribosomal protein L7/L12